MTAPPILDLGALDPDRPVIRIDGTDYHLRVAMDLSLETLARIDKLQKQISELHAVPKRETPDQKITRNRKVDDVLIEAVQTVMYDLPPEVNAKLHAVQRLAVIDSFTRATGRAVRSQRTKTAPPINRRQRRTLARSLRASGGSTPATPTASG